MNEDLDNLMTQLNLQAASDHDEEQFKAQRERAQREQARPQQLENNKARMLAEFYGKYLTQPELIAAVDQKLDTNMLQSDDIRAIQLNKNGNFVDHEASAASIQHEFINGPRPLLSTKCEGLVELAMENFTIKENGEAMSLKNYVLSFIHNFFKNNGSIIDLESCKKEQGQLHVALLENMREGKDTRGVDAEYKIEVKFESAPEDHHLVRIALKPSDIDGEYTPITDKGIENRRVFQGNPRRAYTHVFANTGVLNATAVRNKRYFDLKDSDDPNNKALINHIENKSHTIVITALCVPHTKIKMDGPGSDLSSDSATQPIFALQGNSTGYKTIPGKNGKHKSGF